jgi:2-dehydropantoate 2-reductase
MKICIIGAGAIGGYLAVRLAQAGETVTVIARGKNLAAIREQGLRLETATGERETVRPALATDAVAAAGPQDLVIVAVKSQRLAGVAPALPALYHEKTIVLPAQNGIPWWYFQRHGGSHEGRRIAAVDPAGIIEAHIPIERVIGCVVYPAAELAAPALIRHLEGNRFTLGEPDGSKSERVQQVARTFAGAGLKAPVRPRIRSEIWIKLWGNLAFNPVSALTRATLGGIVEHEPARMLVRMMMLEAQAIAEALGIEFGISVDRRIAGVAGIGAHKTSTLQDIEAGRATEVDALLGAVAELGRLTGTPCPHIDAVYACVKLLEQNVTS